MMKPWLCMFMAATLLAQIPVPNGTPSVQREIINRNFEYIKDNALISNVLASGAKADGSCDNLAINRALTAAGDGAVVVFPTGKTFTTCGSIKPLARQTLWGYGAKLKRRNVVSTTTATAISSGSTNAITVANSAGFQVGMEINVFNGATYDTSNRTISAISGNQITTSTSWGVNLPSGGTVISSSVQININNPDVKVFGLELDGNAANNTSLRKWEAHVELYASSDRLRIRDVYIHDAQSEGMEIFGADTSVANSSVVNANGNCIHYGTTSGARVQNSYFKTCNILGASTGHADGAISFSNATGDSIISGNYFDTAISAVGSIDSDDNSSVIITGNVIRNMTYAVEAITPATVSAGKFVVAENLIYNSGNIAITNAGATGGSYQVIITSNYLENTSITAGGGYSITISGNNMSWVGDTAHNGIGISNAQGNPTKQVLITGNQLLGYGWGISVLSVAEGVTISHNTLKNQYYKSIFGQVAAPVHAVNNYVNTDVGATWASYIAIQLENGASIENNRLELKSGQYGIYGPAGGASTLAAIITGNVVHGGTTSSIMLGASNNFATNNYCGGGGNTIRNDYGSANTVGTNYTIN